MVRGSLPALAALEIGDEPEAWERAGFAVGPGGEALVGSVVLRFIGRAAGAGIRGWALRAASDLPASIDGIATTAIAPDEPLGGTVAAHPNGALGLDHVVVSTPAFTRTIAALEGAGIELRRTREAGSPERPLRQGFLWAGDVLVEVAGPPDGDGEDPARLWGLVAVSEDLERLSELPGPVIGEIRDAVQPGRRIATVPRELGLSVPLAFMTPHPKTAP